MNKESIKLIYDLFVAYLPAITAMLTCVLTLVKCISAISSNKADNAVTRKQIEEMKATVEVMRNETSNMAVENRKLQNKLNKYIDRKSDLYDEKLSK